MRGAVENVEYTTFLCDFARIHDHDIITGLGDDSKVMGNQDD